MDINLAIKQGSKTLKDRHDANKEEREVKGR